jgi:hypothetical protein
MEKIDTSMPTTMWRKNETAHGKYILAPPTKEREN